MNKNALTEQRRETVIGLLKSMNIKKSTMGGFDKDDVYECMQQLCDLYEKNIEELENAYEGEINELRDRYQKYDENNELYVSLIMEAKKSSNDIINQAKNEVETILSEGREQVAQQEKELEQMRNGMETEKNAMTNELNAFREAVEAEKAAMNAEVEAEKEKASALKTKYRQQINVMEEEFAEIKTNILRTAGRIDSIKSKLVDDEAATWNVTEELDAVNFPVAETEVDEIIEPEVHINGQEKQDNENVTEESLDADGEVSELKLEDLVAPQEDRLPESAEEKPADEELNFDDIEIELPDMEEKVSAESVKEETPADEISFEGLEDLFKEDNKEEK